MEYQDLAVEIAEKLRSMELHDKISALNEVRKIIGCASPFRGEPVDCVQWIPISKVTANDYNPNSVAPPEMELLKVSIDADGYTQPIVAMPNEIGGFEVVDGFHRNRVGRECESVQARIHGHLPVVSIREEQYDKTKRMASTIRHNRARGKHKVEAMSDIVVELKNRNWSNDRISRELGMDEDEILRLCQITGLADLFKDSEFSKSWDVEGEITEMDFIELTDDAASYEQVRGEFRTVNTGDEGRIFHTYEEWECYKAGFYATTAPDGMKKQDCEEAYRDFLADPSRFSAALDSVITEWKNSCEHYLTNVAMNRIAWLGQAAMCYATRIPSQFRSGFFLLSETQQNKANQIALDALNRWLMAGGRSAVTMEEAYSGDRQSDIY